jgi:hypothetical protein
MPYPYRPRTFFEALFESPLIGSHNGERGVGPTLGEDVGELPLPAARGRGEPRVFAPRPRPAKQRP